MRLRLREGVEKRGREGAEEDEGREDEEAVVVEVVKSWRLGGGVFVSGSGPAGESANPEVSRGSMTGWSAFRLAIDMHICVY